MTLNPEEPGGGEYDNINVVVRVRPLTPHENNRKNSQALNYPGEGQVLVDDPNSGQTKLFTFTVVFEPEATQEDVFEHCGIKRLIDMALDGELQSFCACDNVAGALRVYGTKRHEPSRALPLAPSELKLWLLPACTKSLANDEGGGDNQQEPGIMQLAFGYLFAEIQLRKGVEYVVQASYLEVYKEHVLDLLNPSPKTLPVRWSKDKGFYAENLFVVECEDLGDLDGVLQEGRKNRQVRSHEMNEHSSRSHTILSISLASEIQDPDDPNTYIRRQGKLSLVDLAGSEKTKKTKSKGNTLTEANNINKSLLVLGNCISCLADPKKRSGHIPYRDSTLTKLLADSLGGNGMALIVACVSPSASNAPETINTLRYASRAKRVKTKPMVRMDPRELLILSLRREVRLLRMENSYLRQQMMTNGRLQLNGIVPVGGVSPDGDSGIDLMRDGHPPAEEGDPKNERALLHKYMTENESLRVENATMHHMREMLVRDHELVCRENERLLKRLDAVERGYAPDSANSLNDIVKTTTESTLVPQPNQETDEEAKARRRNSWGSGIPKLKEKLAGRASSNAKVVADKGRAPNTIVAALTPRSIRRTGSNRVAPAPTGNPQKASFSRPCFPLHAPPPTQNSTAKAIGAQVQWRFLRSGGGNTVY
ncbi:hypothetical protein HPB47_028397 [Ixodes persulcatus]|uniref:Uncharacterized protein n=1 Tax=Ixodes persulcatus TaxID=34615 RepID=A0AC60PUU4_IXOPE|nr:hypothetical protein HPB47_028397 [Ixodes persulcatus]